MRASKCEVGPEFRRRHSVMSRCSSECEPISCPGGVKSFDEFRSPFRDLAEDEESRVTPASERAFNT